MNRLFLMGSSLSRRHLLMNWPCIPSRIDDARRIEKRVEAWSRYAAQDTIEAMPTFFETPAKFRAWFKRHGATEPELIVGFYKAGSGHKSITWSESVDEALCFGWIDGVRTRIDDTSYKIRFTPRRPTSIWSAINIEKVGVLQAAGRMTKAGLDAFARRDEKKSRTYAYEQAKRAELSPDQAAEFKKNQKAWKFFEAQAQSYRHMAAWYVISARRPETRQARLARIIAASANGVRI